jgi:hypothetical protein
LLSEAILFGGDLIGRASVPLTDLSDECEHTLNLELFAPDYSEPSDSTAAAAATATASAVLPKKHVVGTVELGLQFLNLLK